MTRAARRPGTEGDAGSSARTGAVPDMAVLQEAAHWFATLGASRTDPADVLAWQRWHAAGPVNREAWARVQAISGRFAQLPTDDKPAARAVLTQTQRLAARRCTLRALTVLGITGTGVWAGVDGVPWDRWSAAHRTAVGERRDLRLADGGGLWLNTATALDVSYEDTLRRVILHTGEILVETVPDTVVPARPFVVDTEHARLQALGTRFTVRQDDGRVDLAVFSGAVQVQRHAAGSIPQTVRAGQQARLSAAAEVTPVASPAMASVDWTRGLLVADNLPLGELLAELSRHRRGYLGWDADVADIRIVGTYALDDTDRVLAALQATLPIRVSRLSRWWVRVQARHRTA